MPMKITPITPDEVFKDNVDWDEVVEVVNGLIKQGYSRMKCAITPFTIDDINGEIADYNSWVSLRHMDTLKNVYREAGWVVTNRWDGENYVLEFKKKGQ